MHADAKTADSKVTGRTKPFALTGLVVGAVGGAAAGYFLNGNSLKAPAIGAGIGAGASAGLGAMIGGSMDKHYTQKAASLRELAGTLKSYDSAKAEASLQGESLKLYQQHLSSAGIHDLDQATVLNNEIQGTQQRVQKLDQKLEQVLKIHQTEKK